MDKTKQRKKKVQQQPKLSFGTALKQNVYIINNIIFLNKNSLKIQITQGKREKQMPKRVVESQPQYQYQKQMKVIIQIKPLIPLQVKKIQQIIEQSMKIMKIKEIFKIFPVRIPLCILLPK